MITKDWRIKSRSHTCHQSGQQFKDGESFFTALFELPESEDAQFERRDYSTDAWEALAEDEPGPFSFWRSTYEAPESVGNSDIVEKESAEALLRRLIEDDEAATENARYILAVMLERKKILRETGVKETENESRLLFYEHAKSGEVFIIKDPQLRLDQVEAIQGEVSQRLGGRAPAREAPEETAADEQPNGTPS